jgi:hypothetical protein
MGLAGWCSGRGGATLGFAGVLAGGVGVEGVVAGPDGPDLESSSG